MERVAALKEVEGCTFAPSIHKSPAQTGEAGYTTSKSASPTADAVEGYAASSFDVVERAMAWQSQKELRLLAAQRAEEVARQRLAAKTIVPPPPLSAPTKSTVPEWASGAGSEPPPPLRGGGGGEPHFMAPTAAAQNRLAGTLPFIASYEENYAPQAVSWGSGSPLPEWAAPQLLS